MNKTILITMTLISIFLLISCSKKVETCTVTEKDGIKAYRNKNIPSVEKLDFNPVLKFTLNNDSNDVHFVSYSDFDLIDIDSEENIYISDIVKTRVNKYDNKGNFVKTFIQKGLGPGEMNAIAFLAIKNDTLYLGDRENGTISKFKTSGEFIEKFKPNGDVYQVRAVGLSRFIGFTIKYKQVENRWLLTYELTLLNNSFEPLKKFNKLEFFGDEMNVIDLWTYMTITEDKIFVAVNDKMFYKVNVFDHDGNLIEEINKSYSAKGYTEQEYNKISEFLIKSNQGKIQRRSMKKKRAVVGVFSDKNGNIIIQPAVDTSKGNTKGIVMDFFKDNTYLNTYIFEPDKPYLHYDFNTSIDFMGNKIYKYDSERSKLDVYEY
ncbi:MAG: hypothetical protein GQ534_04415 [Candidatus Delongbacteria bacterium]|nr:hypothetical protein [Candidatus Delongbacteria bacterium]